VICNRAKPNRRGGDFLQPLGFPDFPWEIVGIDYIIDHPKIGLYGHTTILLWFVT
jgi:hypothetical protein